MTIQAQSKSPAGTPLPPVPHSHRSGDSQEACSGWQAGLFVCRIKPNWRRNPLSCPRPALLCFRWWWYSWRHTYYWMTIETNCLYLACSSVWINCPLPLGHATQWGEVKGKKKTPKPKSATEKQEFRSSNSQRGGFAGRGRGGKRALERALL